MSKRFPEWVNTEVVIKAIKMRQEGMLSKALNLMGYKPNTIVVELNNLIINSIKWEKVKLKDGDNLEIVSIVGGG